MKRAVIYARFSSEGQREASIEDQVRSCLKLVENRGWEASGIYSDRALSGATTLRPDYQRLLADARNRVFDLVVAEGLDRLSRDQEATAGLYKLLSFLGIGIVTRAEGEISELHVGLKGTMNAIFLKDLAIKTHRGLEGRVRQGKSGGGRAYGYNVVRQRDHQGEPVRGLREVNSSEAVIVRRIFAEFGQGQSPRAVARALNAAGIVGPNGKAWRDTTIRGHATRRTGILRNDLYAGKLVWNKQTYVRNPDTGRRVARARHVSERIVTDVPELRIVDQGLWDIVQHRLDAIGSSPRSQAQRKSEFWKHRRAKHLLTGLIHCGACGGLLAAVGKDYLACSVARSGAGCTNRKSIKRSLVEEVVLEGLKTRLMAPELVEEFIGAFHAEQNSVRAAHERRHQADEVELRRISQKLQGLYDAIADGLRTPGMQNQLLELEARETAMKKSVAAAPAPSPRFHPRLARIYRDTVADLHTALSDPEARTEAAEILRGLVERISVSTDPRGYCIELIGNIVKLMVLPGGVIPDAYAGSVKVVAGAGFDRDLICKC